MTDFRAVFLFCTHFGPDLSAYRSRDRPKPGGLLAIRRSGGQRKRDDQGSRRLTGFVLPPGFGRSLRSGSPLLFRVTPSRDAPRCRKFIRTEPADPPEVLPDTEADVKRSIRLHLVIELAAAYLSRFPRRWIVSPAGAAPRELFDDHHIARLHDLSDTAVPGARYQHPGRGVLPCGHQKIARLRPPSPSAS